VVSRTSCAVRDRSHRSSGCCGSGAADGSKLAIEAYVRKNETEFQNVSRRRFTSSARP
jgi:hypothetical protein